jgi:hypothetical protein
MTTPHSFDLRYQSEQRANCEPWNWYTLHDFLDHGLFNDPERAQKWLDADMTPVQASHYEAMGMTPTDAWAWGMVPDAVRSFRDAGFELGEAWSWANHLIFGYEAMFWRYGGYTPEEANALRTSSEPFDPALTVLWALTNLSAVEALEHALGGANPADFLRPPMLEGRPLPDPPREDLSDAPLHRSSRLGDWYFEA